MIYLKFFQHRCLKKYEYTKKKNEKSLFQQTSISRRANEWVKREREVSDVTFLASSNMKYEQTIEPGKFSMKNFLGPLLLVYDILSKFFHKKKTLFV